VELTERNQSLKIEFFKWDNVGEYRCVVKNILHKDSKHGYVTIAGERERESGRARERENCMLY